MPTFKSVLCISVGLSIGGTAALAVPAGTQKEVAAKEFINWATSKIVSGTRLPLRKAGQTYHRALALLSMRILNTKKCLSLR